MPEELSNRFSTGDALSRSAPGGADTGLSDDESALFGKLSRRHFLTIMSAAGAGLFARQLSAQQETLKAAETLRSGGA